LEEFYAEDLEGYSNALAAHLNHNYYFGRNEADITPWLDYFLKGMSVVFERVAEGEESHSKGEAFLSLLSTTGLCSRKSIPILIMLMKAYWIKN